MKDGIAVTCNVRISVRERGKLITVREGHNVWTNAGREYDCLLKTYNPATAAGFRNDRIDYIGVGTGAQVESVSVTSLVTPVTYDGNNFLAQIDRNRTVFPLEPTKTAVRYIRNFAVDQISVEDTTVYITECGLFTDGDPDQNYTPGTRVTDIIAAEFQVPIAYHSFEPVPKTKDVELEIIWELRH